MNKTRFSLLSAAVLCCLPLPAAAQQLEEVLVTAQKREQSLQDVAISVAVVSGEELARRNKTQISELSQLVPGFTFGQGTSDAGRNIFVRGIGTQSFSRSVEQSVGTVVDGVVAASLGGSLLDFNDVARIELLRGPQGMLFGKNASAGLLSITTKNPTPQFSAGFGARYGSENLLNLNGYLSGPLVEDRLLGRVAAFSNTRDAMLDNNFPGADDINDRDDSGVRAKLRWLVKENLDIQLNYNHLERDQVCCIGPLRDVIPGSVADREGGPVGDDVDEILDQDKPLGETEADIYSVELNWSFGEYQLTAISAYSDEEVFGAARGDLYTRTPLPANDSFGEYEQFTQEVRIASPEDRTVSYVAGLYYFDWDLDRTFLRIIDLFGVDQCPVPGCGSLTVTNDHTNTNKSFAVFGQLTWNITDTARLSAGARYNDDEISIDQTVGFLPGTIPEAPPGSIAATTENSDWSWRLIGELDIAADAMAYASVARGYKGPGSNSLTSGPTSGDVFVDPEIPTNYEIGIKSQWLDNRVRFNGAVYFTRFKDFQASTQVPDAFPPRFFLANAGELETRGVEVELTAQVLPNLAVHTAIAYTDAIFSDWKDAPCYSLQTVEEGCVDGIQDLTGADMPVSPDWAYNVTADYYIPVPSQNFTGFVSGTWFWSDKVMYDTTNNPLHEADAYGQLDVAAGITADDGRYTLQFFVENLLDNFYVNSLSGQSAVGILTGHGLPYDYKRRFGVSLSMDF
ncbi:MAG: TonB-dependent receptor [Halioglobus sp.]|nr:TonB-dependent receptor [Halioglobus sp.]